MLTERLLDRTPVWLLYAGTALLLFAAISQEPLVDVARRISSAPSFAGFR